MNGAFFAAGAVLAVAGCASASSGTAMDSGGTSTTSPTSGGGDQQVTGGGGQQAKGGGDQQVTGGGDQQVTGGAAAGSSPGGAPDAGAPSAIACDELAQLVASYAAAHPGQDGDINAKTPDQIAADVDAQTLLGICGDARRPVIPLLAWEYGGSDHAWLNPEQSALAYCVYTPVAAATDHWAYDQPQDLVSADVYVTCPDHNPCKDEQGAAQVSSCIGDRTNFEILVDTASFDDGADAGLRLANAATELSLILDGGAKVPLYTDP